MPFPTVFYLIQFPLQVNKKKKKLKYSCFLARFCSIVFSSLIRHIHPTPFCISKLDFSLKYAKPSLMLGITDQMLSEWVSWEEEEAKETGI